MKKIRMALLAMAIIAFSVTTSEAEQGSGNYNIVNRVTDSDNGSDYIFHYGAGMLIGGLAKHYLPKEWVSNPWARSGIAIGVAVVVKLAFELFDSPFREEDLLDYGLGAAVGVAGVTLYEWKF